MSKIVRSALYYPHTSVDNEELLKSALLTWDKLEYLVPWDGFSPTYSSRNAARAMELIGAQRCPTDKEKETTHERIEELLSSDLPAPFYLSGDGRPLYDEAYEVYPQKLHEKTWELLLEHEMRSKVLRNYDYLLSEPAGLTIMSILADSCAGQRKARITDQGDAYAALASIGTNLISENSVDGNNLLIPISLNVLDVSGFSLGEVIEMREREEKESGTSLRDLRHRYIDSLQNYVENLRTEVSSESDAKEALRTFRDDMKIDLDNLKKELSLAGREVILSKEMLVTTIAAVGAVASWVLGAPVALSSVISSTGGPVTVGGFMAIRNKFVTARRAVMQKHPMAYLYYQSRKSRQNQGRAWMPIQ